MEMETRSRNAVPSRCPVSVVPQYLSASFKIDTSQKVLDLLWLF
jgi:hypothetical protein